MRTRIGPLGVAAAALLAAHAPAFADQHAQAAAGEPGTAAEGAALGEAGETGVPASAVLASAEEMIGATVRGEGGIVIGTVSDVVLDDEGQPRQLVVETAEGEGIEAGRTVAIDFDTAQLALDEGLIVASGIGADDVGAMEDFQYGDDVVTLRETGEVPAEGEAPQ